jgi:hypothetical protein
MIKIAGATACIREQHDWCARTAKCAFQRRVTDFDGSMLLQSNLRVCLLSERVYVRRTGRDPRDRPTFVPGRLREGDHGPEFLPSDVTEGGRYRWSKPDSIAERHWAWE